MESELIRCGVCGTPLGGEQLRASISARIMGDEYTDDYYFCAACGVYMVRTLHDRFLGPESVILSGPIPGSDGDEQVLLIQSCPQPTNGRCRCPSHRQHFRDSLD